MRKRCLFSMGILLALYGLNRFCLVPLTGSRLLAWHGADALAGAWMLCLVELLLELAKRPPLRRLIPVWTYLLGCGLFWEYVTPLYLPRSVSDPWDILAVWLGGTVMLLILHPANWARSQSSPPPNKE